MSKYECPYCHETLSRSDLLGVNSLLNEFVKVGEIFFCNNEDCEAYRRSFHEHTEQPYEGHS